MGARMIFSRGGQIHKIHKIHRRSQDFLCGVHFFFTFFPQKKLTAFGFSRRPPQNTGQTTK